MSQFLQSKYGAIHKEREEFKKPYYIAGKSNLSWDNTIKGDEANNYYPARTFLYELIDKDLPEFGFIKYLIVPEIEINEITQSDDKKFKNQCVDFYLPQAQLVIEIDGQQHKRAIGRLTDAVRDKHLQLFKCETVRIDTRDLNARNAAYNRRIDRIRCLLTENQSLSKYKDSFDTPYENIPKEIVSKKLMPAAIIRFQVLLLELIENGYISLDDESWEIEVKNHDVSNYENDAINDIFEWFHHLFSLQKIPFSKPFLNIKSVKSFSQSAKLKVDFSLLQRWTDEPQYNCDVIYVRTDYSGLYYNRLANRMEAVNNFKLSITSPYTYRLSFGDDSSDIDSLKFFLKNLFEYDLFHQGQEQIIKSALERNDTIGLLPTGGGKSLTYQMACLLQPCISFVVCPIKSLMYDQVIELKNSNIEHVAAITSELDGANKDAVLNKFGQGMYFCIFISPERFQNDKFRLQLQSISQRQGFAYAVIDEVHCLSEWGHDFRTSYLNLSKTIRRFCSGTKFLGLTATASSNVLKDIIIEFDIEQKNIKTLPDYTRPELEFIVIKDNSKKYGELTKIIQEQGDKHQLLDLGNSAPKAGLIFTPFVNSTFGCFGLSHSLKSTFNVPVNYYSGSMPEQFPGDEKAFSKYKNKVQVDFKNDKFPLLTATKAFGMGVNKKNISFTVHYGIPSSMEALYQEAGRAGRDKSVAQCYVLLSEEQSQSELDELFSANVTHAQMHNINERVGKNGQDVFRQLFLYLNGQEAIEDDLALLVKLHKTYSVPNSQKTIYAKSLGSDKALTEKAIYRLSNLGIIEDWTVNDFFNGIFTVQYASYSDESIHKNLLKFIQKYTNDFDFDAHPDHEKYTAILRDGKLKIFERYAKILLQWSYDKFGANRRESLYNVYKNCQDFDDSKEGRAKFKQLLEAYFKFTDATFILQHIADNNNKGIDKWDRVFLDEDKRFIDEGALIDLEGNLQRFLESYQTNTGLNLIYALTLLLLDKDLTPSDLSRFKSSIEAIQAFDDSDLDLAMETIYFVLKRLKNEKRKGMRSILDVLYEFCASDEELYESSRKFNDEPVFIECCNRKISTITNKLKHGPR